LEGFFNNILSFDFFFVRARIFFCL
jgi:hypothetical protein